MKKILLLALSLLIVSTLEAHIGSPDIVYEGNAGPYKLYAIIQAPDVVPGVAKVFISFLDGKNRKVSIQPVYYQYGSNGAPPADPASPVENTTGQYEGRLWLMGFGSSSVKINIEGEKGFGATIVPVLAAATATRKMETGTGIVLGILGLILFFGLLSILSACITEATMKPGDNLTPTQQRKARMVMVIVGVSLLIGLFFAKQWWNAVEGQYRQKLYQPLLLESKLESFEKGNRLRLNVSNRNWPGKKITTLDTDHGKVMHLFMVDKNKNTFAHLHPIQEDSSLFYINLPGLPEGQYYLYADIVHKDGMSETLTDTIQLSSSNDILLEDPDDSWAQLKPSGNQLQLKEGLKMIADFPNEIKPGQMVNLGVRIEDKDGKTTLLQPYLGMAGHAVVMKEDGKVFIHLHPMGTISMKAQMALASKVQDKVSICGVIDSIEATNLDTLGIAGKQGLSMMKNKVNGTSSYPGQISFPYIFPSSGKYRCWVQVKKSDKILTGVFEVLVK